MLAYFPYLNALQTRLKASGVKYYRPIIFCVIHICPKFLVGTFSVLSFTPRNKKKHCVASPNPQHHSHVPSGNTMLYIYLSYVYTVVILAFSRNICECSACLNIVIFISNNFENEARIFWSLPLHSTLPLPLDNIFVFSFLHFGRKSKQHLLVQVFSANCLLTVDLSFS